MPCWTPMFLTIFPQEVITTLLQNSTIHLRIKNTPWWRNSSVKNCSDKKSGISWNCPHQIVSQLESVWNYVNLTSTLTSLANSLVTSTRGSSLVSAGPQHISQVVKSHPGCKTKYHRQPYRSNVRHLQRGSWGKAVAPKLTTQGDDPQVAMHFFGRLWSMILPGWLLKIPSSLSLATSYHSDWLHWFLLNQSW